MKSLWTWLTLATLSLGFSDVALGQERKAEPKPATRPSAPTTQSSQDELEKQFSETMTGAVLVGKFTARGHEQNAKEDRYTIVSARKLFGERWVITARIQYRGETVPIPIIVPVKWAGDTPVISVTDMTIPGMGSYTARVMFFRDQYSGMWDAGDHGGLMWGKIEHPGATTGPATRPAAGKAETPK
jgi:hypothetical protein